MFLSLMSSSLDGTSFPYKKGWRVRLRVQNALDAYVNLQIKNKKNG